MNLYLLRHAIAEDRTVANAADDSKRPLTPEGEKKMRRIAKGMKQMELAFDLILSSPYARAKQTAEIVAAAFKGQRKLKFTEHLTPEGDPEELIEHMNHFHSRPKDVVLVGHEPYLSELASRLLTGREGLSMTFKKGGLCKLAVERLRYGKCATLEWLLTPGQLADLR